MRRISFLRSEGVWRVILDDAVWWCVLFGVATALAGCASINGAADRSTDHEDVSPPPPQRLALGEQVSCAVSADEQVTCWGDEPLGNSSTTTISASSDIEEITYTNGRLCVLDSADRLRCWGNTDLQGVEVHKFEEGGWIPDPMKDGRFRSMALGDSHACAVTKKGTMSCVGHGRVDYIDEGYRDYDQAVPADGKWRSVEAARYRTCGIRTDRRVVCWGQRMPGVKLPATFDGEFIDIGVGRFTVCGLRSTGGIQCWGLGSRPDVFEAKGDVDQGVPRAGRYRSVRIAQSHACAITVEGRVRCWGLGEHPDRFEGEADFDQAVPIDGLGEAVTSLGTGKYHSCAMLEDGVACWGAGLHPDDSDKSVRRGHGQARPPDGLRSEAHPETGGSE